MFDRRFSSVLLGVVLGACATAAVESAAIEPEPEPAPLAAEPGPPAAVIALEAATVRQSPDGSATITHLTRGKNAYVGRLTLQPAAAVPEHQDASEEYIHVLSGAGTVTIDGQAHEVQSGTTIFMPANATVAFQNGAEPMVALQVFAGPESASKYGDWLDPSATPVQRPKR